MDPIESVPTPTPPPQTPTPYPHTRRPAIVTHFRVTEHQLEQLGRDVQPFLQYFVLRPQARPPPQADGACLSALGQCRDVQCFEHRGQIRQPPSNLSTVPLMLSTRSLVEMEAGEAQLQAAFWERADPPEDVEASFLGEGWGVGGLCCWMCELCVVLY